MNWELRISGGLRNYHEQTSLQESTTSFTSLEIHSINISLTRAEEGTILVIFPANDIILARPKHEDAFQIYILFQKIRNYNYT